MGGPPVARRTGADDLPPGALDDQAVEPGLDLGHLGSDLLPQTVVVAQVLRRDPADQFLGLFDEAVQLLIGADVEVLLTAFVERTLRIIPHS